MVSTREFEMKAVPINEVDPSPWANPVPIPEPYDELAAMTIELSIVKLSIAEIPPVVAKAVPIPEPFDKLDAFTREPHINRLPIPACPASRP
jgi:hypothetical protein